MSTRTDWSNRSILVGGASGGVGRAAADSLLQAGARVGLHYRSNEAPVRELVDAYGSERAIPLRADLTDRESVRALVPRLRESLQSLDGVINTVGTALRMRPLLEIDDEMIDETIALELRSVIDLTRAVLPLLIESGHGRLVYVGSDSGKVGTSGETISAACRGGLISFAKSVAREHARDNVLVNVVCPGPTDTSLWRDLTEHDEVGRKIGTAMARGIPLRRIGQPEEVAAMTVFLMGDEASYITGQAISVSGGLTMA